MTSNQVKIPEADKRRLFSFALQKKNGVVLLEGPSGCGITALMQELVQEAEFPLFLTSQELVELLLSAIKKEGFIADAIDRAVAILEEFGLVIIEDFDMQKGKEATLETIGKLVKRLSQNAVVLFTGIRLSERVPALLEQVHIDLWIKVKEKE